MPDRLVRRLRAAGLSLAAVLAALTAGTAPAAAAAPPRSDGSGAASDVAAMLASATPSRAAAVPGGAVVDAPAGTVATALGGGAVQVRASSCAAQEDALRAGRISRYTCAAVQVAGAGRVSPAVTYPHACSSGTGTLTGWVAVDRRHACNHIEIDIVVIEHPSGKVVGTLDLHAVNTQVASTTRARWHSTSYMWVWGATGIGFPGYVDGHLFPEGCSNCIGENGTWKKLWDDASWRGAEDIDLYNMPAGSVQHRVGGFWEARVGSPKWDNDVIVDYHLALSRCDNKFGGQHKPPGCVFSNIAAVAGFSQAAVPQFVRHVYGAQVSGLPGRMGTGSYLSRLTDAALIAKNGRKACPRSLTAPPGSYDCDEYPFRSTHQGASTSGAAHARSQPWCHMPDPRRTGAHGWSRCFIDRSQNRSAGGTLLAFYGRERYLDGDRFQVGYLP